jgi:uncharacterized protein (TIGR03663 family)
LRFGVNLPSKSVKFWLLFAAILILALALRLPNLAQRPMHTDEAVHAIKFGSLLENNDYKYDPYEYHGPTLNYFTLVPAWLSNAKNLVDVSEVHLRLVTLFFGLLLIPGFLFLRKELGDSAVLAGAFLTTISPAFVFYSRYYIQEMLFTAFSFYMLVFVFKFLQKPILLWAILGGTSIGLFFATKETCIISFGALILSVLFIVLRKKTFKFEKKTLSYVLLGFSAFAAVSIIFYSSFLSYPKGIVDSLLTFKTYLGRGVGEHQAHLYPWYYYFKWILFNKMPGSPFWTEAFVVVLALFGMIHNYRSNKSETNKSLSAYLLIFAGALILIYSVIPYKTPWSMLSWYHILIVFGGIGMAGLLKLSSGKISKSIVSVLLILGSAHLVYQVILQNGKYSSDISNPYVYAHTHPDIYHIKDKIGATSAAHKDGKNMYIEVICPGGDYWPLPWYLREYPNVAYWSEVNLQSPLAQIVIAKPKVEDDVMKKMFEIPPPGQRNMYLPLFDDDTELRPFVELQGYVRKDLFDKYYYSQP